MSTTTKEKIEIVRRILTVLWEQNPHHNVQDAIIWSKAHEVLVFALDGVDDEVVADLIHKLETSKNRPIIDSPFHQSGIVEEAERILREAQNQDGVNHLTNGG